MSMIPRRTRIRPTACALAVATVALLLLPGAGPPGDRAALRSDPDVAPNRPLSLEADTKARPAVPPPSRPAVRTAPAAAVPAPSANASASTNPPVAPFEGPQLIRSVQTVGLLALVSLAPAAVLMVTAFVRINIVLVLLRQALGSPQVPGNQVLTALALLLTALVMRPVGETVYTRAIEPYASGRIGWVEAYRAGSVPIKAFMVAQIEATHHEKYLWELYDLAVPEAPGQVDPVYGEEFPMRVVAPAFLLSELTTALIFGFFLYLPFLVIDLVVAAVLAAMGLFMMPPSLVALPLKLILFVLADGWLHVATKLLESFGTMPSG
jgi:flagellar biosynthesis protein FliP